MKVRNRGIIILFIITLITLVVSNSISGDLVRAEEGSNYAENKEVIDSIDVKKIYFNSKTVSGYAANNVFESNIPVGQRIYLKAFNLKKGETIVLSEKDDYTCSVEYNKVGSTKSYSYRCNINTKYPYIKIGNAGNYNVTFIFNKAGGEIYKYNFNIKVSSKYDPKLRVGKDDNRLNILQDLGVEEIIGDSDLNGYYTSNTINVASEVESDSGKYNGEIEKISLNKTDSLLPKGIYDINLYKFKDIINSINYYGRIVYVKVYRLNIDGNKSVMESDYKPILKKKYSTPTYNPTIRLDTRKGDCAFKIEFMTEDNRIFKAFTPTYKVSSELPLLWINEKGNTAISSIITQNGLKYYNSSPQNNGAFVRGNINSIENFVKNRIGVYNNIEFEKRDEYTKNKDNWQSLNTEMTGNNVLKINKENKGSFYSKSELYLENINITNITSNIDVYECFIEKYGEKYVEDNYGLKFNKLIDGFDNGNEDLINKYIKDLRFINKAQSKINKTINTHKVLNINYKNPYDIAELTYSNLPEPYINKIYNDEDVIINGLYANISMLDELEDFRVYVNLPSGYRMIRNMYYNFGMKYDSGLYTVRIVLNINGVWHTTIIKNCPIIGTR